MTAQQKQAVNTICTIGAWWCVLMLCVLPASVRSFGFLFGVLGFHFVIRHFEDA